MIFESIFYNLIYLLINMPGNINNSNQDIQFSQRRDDNQPDNNQPDNNQLSENQASQDINRGHAASLLSQIKSLLKLEPRNIIPSIIMPTIITIWKLIIFFGCIGHVRSISGYCGWLAAITETGKDESNLPTICKDEMCINKNYSSLYLKNLYIYSGCDSLIEDLRNSADGDPNQSCDMGGENSLNQHLPSTIPALFYPLGMDAMAQLITFNKRFQGNEHLPFACFYNMAYGIFLFMALMMQDENIDYLKPDQNIDIADKEGRWLAKNIECKIKEHEDAIKTSLNFINSTIYPSIACAIITATGLAAAKFKSYCEGEQVTNDVEMQMRNNQLEQGTQPITDYIDPNAAGRPSSVNSHAENSASINSETPPQSGQGAGYSSSDEESGTDAVPAILTAGSVIGYSGEEQIAEIMMPMPVEITSQTTESMQNQPIPTAGSAPWCPRGELLRSIDITQSIN